MNLHRPYRTWWESCWVSWEQIGVGFFIYGAYMYLTASRERPTRWSAARAAMMTALAGIVLAMVAYGVVELVMNAVVGSTRWTPTCPTRPPRLPRPTPDGG